MAFKLNPFTGNLDDAGSGLPYLTYAAVLNQAGTDAPVATVLQNTLGGAVVWSRSAAGHYRATLAGAFPANKTLVIIGNASNFGGSYSGDFAVMYAVRLDDNIIRVNTSTVALAANSQTNEDSILTDEAFVVYVFA